jgi:hypothetical protein
MAAKFRAGEGFRGHSTVPSDKGIVVANMTPLAVQCVGINELQP